MGVMGGHIVGMILLSGLMYWWCAVCAPVGVVCGCGL